MNDFLLVTPLRVVSFTPSSHLYAMETTHRINDHWSVAVEAVIIKFHFREPLPYIANCETKRPETPGSIYKSCEFFVPLRKETASLSKGSGEVVPLVPLLQVIGYRLIKYCSLDPVNGYAA